MLEFFLDRLRANEDTVDMIDPKVIKAIDCKLISGYDAAEVATQLQLGIPTDKHMDLTPIFYNRLFLAYLINDTGFDNTSWGIHAETLQPMRYVPKTPFTAKDTHLQYKWGELQLTPDLMIIVKKNKAYALEACKLLINWYKDRGEMFLDYSKKSGMKDTAIWAERFHEIDSRAYDAYMSILTFLHNDANFISWIKEQPSTEIIDDIVSGVIVCMKCNIESSVDALGYCLNYLREVTPSVAGGRS